jgi:hypothetical protein
MDGMDGCWEFAFSPGAMNTPESRSGKGKGGCGRKEGGVEKAEIRGAKTLVSDHLVTDRRLNGKAPRPPAVFVPLRDPVGNALLAR